MNYKVILKPEKKKLFAYGLMSVRSEEVNVLSTLKFAPNVMCEG